MTHHLARSRRHLEHEAIKIRNMTERIKRFNNASKAIQRQDVNRQLTILKNRVIKEFEKAEMGEAAAIARSSLEGSNPPPFTARITIDPEGNVQGVYRVFNKPGTRNLTKTEFIALVQNLQRNITKDKLDLGDGPSHILKRYLAEFVNPKTTR